MGELRSRQLLLMLLVSYLSHGLRLGSRLLTENSSLPRTWNSYAPHMNSLKTPVNSLPVLLPLRSQSASIFPQLSKSKWRRELRLFGCGRAGRTKRGSDPIQASGSFPNSTRPSEPQSPSRFTMSTKVKKRRGKWESRGDGRRKRPREELIEYSLLESFNDQITWLQPRMDWTWGCGARESEETNLPFYTSTLFCLSPPFSTSTYLFFQQSKLQSLQHARSRLCHLCTSFLW